MVLEFFSPCVWRRWFDSFNKLIALQPLNGQSLLVLFCSYFLEVFDRYHKVLMDYACSF